MKNTIHSNQPFSRFILFVVAFALLVPTLAFSQGLGIDAATPNTKLDVNGDLAIRITGLAVANGNNNDISVGAFSFIRLTGPTAVFAITGIAGGVDGKVVILYNTSAQDMTIAHQSGSSTAANRIICSDNSDALVKQQGCATLIYSTTDSRWILASLYKS